MEIINDNQSSVVSTKDWFITIFITAIPIIGFIMLFVWAFGGNAQSSKANWAKATLLWLFAGVILYGIIFMFFGVALLANAFS